MTLDLNDANALTCVHGALVIPPMGGSRAREQASGVLDAEGRFVAHSLSWTASDRPVNAPPAPPAEGDEIRHLPGRYIFGGILYGHFGHFIVESLARLWAQDAVSGPIDGITFTPKAKAFPPKSMEKLQALANLLGLRVPLIVAEGVTRVDELHVPAQGFGMYDLSAGSAAFRAFINRHAGADVAPEGADRLYISRSKLPPMRGSILGEYKLEELLAAEGYDIFHPQRHTPREQIARYKAATHIVAVDCSPLHMLGYVGHGGQKVAIITRRSMAIGGYLVEQLRRFKGMDAQEINRLVNDWMPQPGGRPSRSSWGEMDFAGLHDDLFAGGFIEAAAPWPELSPNEIAAELRRLEASHDTTFRAFREPAIAV